MVVIYVNKWCTIVTRIFVKTMGNAWNNMTVILVLVKKATLENVVTFYLVIINLVFLEILFVRIYFS